MNDFNQKGNHIIIIGIFRLHLFLCLLLCWSVQVVASGTGKQEISFLAEEHSIDSLRFPDRVFQILIEESKSVDRNRKLIHQTLYSLCLVDHHCLSTASNQLQQAYPLDSLNSLFLKASIQSDIKHFTEKLQRHHVFTKSLLPSIKKLIAVLHDKFPDDTQYAFETSPDQQLFEIDQGKDRSHYIYCRSMDASFIEKYLQRNLKPLRYGPESEDDILPAIMKLPLKRVIYKWGKDAGFRKAILDGSQFVTLMFQGNNSFRYSIHAAYKSGRSKPKVSVAVPNKNVPKKEVPKLL